MLKEFLDKFFRLSPEDAKIALVETTLTEKERRGLEESANQVEPQKEKQTADQASN